ncbi:MAG: FeoB-associated Cys-rich membrane protein [Ruminococcaceae bacterium]|nr:FeoB-associated Cys-rich membrane protein [Oscillospiraceae bacterium]
MENVLLTLILMALAAGAIAYIYKVKKKGQACIGCPHAGHCTQAHCQGKEKDGEKTV